MTYGKAQKIAQILFDTATSHLDFLGEAFVLPGRLAFGVGPDEQPSEIGFNIFNHGLTLGPAIEFPLELGNQLRPQGLPEIPPLYFLADKVFHYLIVRS